MEFTVDVIVHKHTGEWIVIVFEGVVHADCSVSHLSSSTRHITGHFVDAFTGHMTQPTVS